MPVPDPSKGSRATRWRRTLLRHDLPASFVVFLVAVPLSLGIAAASGAPLLAGIIAAVVGGIVVGAIGGAPLLVSGPAAGLSVIVADLVIRHGWTATATMVTLAGLLQIVLGLSRFGRAALMLSPAVVHGMLAGIGIVIALSQLHVVLGGAPQRSVWENLRELPAQLVGYHDAAVLVGVVTVAVLLVWPRLVRVSYLPAPLVAITVATAMSSGLDLDLSRVSLPDDPLSYLTLPRWPDAALTDVLSGVLLLAVVASVESLLSAVAVDRLHDGPRARLDRELIAQGVANSASGALGGLPVTGVIVRSSANVEAGARTRASAIMHGLWIAVFALLLASVLELIPMSALAGVLVIVGLRLISVAHVRDLMRHREFPAYAVTVAGVVFLDLVTGVLLGMAVALVAALYRLTHWRIDVDRRGPDEWLVQITGTLLFLGAGRLNQELRRLPPGARVQLELRLDFLDHAAFAVIQHWRAGYERNGGQVRVEEAPDGWFDRAVRDRLGNRKTLPERLPRWLAPWSHWQTGTAPPTRSDTGQPTADTSDPPVAQTTGEIGDNMLVGVREFERRVAPLVRPYLTELARDGQRPSELFITCADSRLVPNLVTASGPGDLFCLRNIGNIVPRHGTPGDHSVGAAIEYATDVLQVSTITVCGHSDCGAMRAVLRGGVARESHLGSWLSHVRLGGRRDDRRGPVAPPPRDPAGPADNPAALERQALANVAQQLANLRTYPSVRRRLEAEQLTLVGLYFDLHEARMYLVDAGNGARRPLPL
ncbi:bifunctional SulP family inorganic anion transporter/carbonic anhydrase [Micromonospora sp. NBC_01699]|uniref:bifunctional SulP family inorganic anion transporter/carbonic anhydrase n=1 Tax=Micromonospora sp. NBC_01699 TaxID=2975984 RepID=UPI002E35ABD2|nr:bifunctional SulP family inorganic anion transporter/carbonic anhydrase [Micromonospora sp. NBC_01699]